MRYRIMPEHKKSTLESITFVKGDKKVIVNTWWRWATFEMESDTKPVLNEGESIYDTLQDVEFIEAGDGDVEYDYENMTDEEIEEVDAFLQENSFLDLSELDWCETDTVWSFHCPIEIEEITE